MAHLLQRLQDREIDRTQLELLVEWLDQAPEVPHGDWYKRFPHLTVCGSGELVKTFLTSSQIPYGSEL